MVEFFSNHCPNDSGHDAKRFSVAMAGSNDGGTPPAAADGSSCNEDAMISKPLILIVDDEPDIVEAVEDLLELEGYRCLTTTDPVVAVDLIRDRADLDLVLTDVRMPGLDGFELARSLKQGRAASRDLGLVFMTGHAGMDEAIEALRIGADDFLTKPFAPERLVHTIGRAVELGQLRAKDCAFSERLEREVERQTREIQGLSDELQNTNEKLLQSNQNLEVANKVKDEFLRMMHHEINTPLNAIIGFAELLKISSAERDDAGAEDDVMAASEILDAGWHLHHHIESIMSMAAADHHDVSLVREQVDLASLIFGIRDLSVGKAAKKMISIETEIAPECGDVLIYCDRARLSQATDCLMDNAIKYSPQNTKICLSAVCSDQEISILVRDWGPGMNEDEVKKALVPFSRGDKTFTFGSEGIGIGLTLARLFTELHGGHVKIQSSPGAGTTVQLTLPRNNLT